MIELARDFNTQFRVSRHGVIINRNAAIGGDKLTVFGQHQRINFQGPGFNAVRGAE